MPMTTNALGARLIVRYRDLNPPTATWAQIVLGHSPYGWISDRDYGLLMVTTAYGRGDATLSDLDGALAAGWITQEEYDSVIPPEEPAQASGGAAQATVKKAAAKKS